MPFIPPDTSPIRRAKEPFIEPYEWIDADSCALAGSPEEGDQPSRRASSHQCVDPDRRRDERSSTGGGTGEHGCCHLRRRSLAAWRRGTTAALMQPPGAGTGRRRLAYFHVAGPRASARAVVISTRRCGLHAGRRVQTSRGGLVDEGGELTYMRDRQEHPSGPGAPTEGAAGARSAVFRNAPKSAVDRWPIRGSHRSHALHGCRRTSGRTAGAME